MGDARDTAKKKKADEKKKTTAKPVAKADRSGGEASGRFAEVNQVMVVHAGIDRPDLRSRHSVECRCFGSGLFSGTGNSRGSSGTRGAAARPRREHNRTGDASSHAPAPLDREAFVSETDSSRFEASGRELHGEWVRRHGVLLIRKLRGKSPCRF